MAKQYIIDGKAYTRSDIIGGTFESFAPSTDLVRPLGDSKKTDLALRLALRPTGVTASDLSDALNAWGGAVCTMLYNKTWLGRNYVAPMGYGVRASYELRPYETVDDTGLRPQLVLYAYAATGGVYADMPHTTKANSKKREARGPTQHAAIKADSMLLRPDGRHFDGRDDVPKNVKILLISK